jgi:hypothetical protein
MKWPITLLISFLITGLIITACGIPVNPGVDSSQSKTDQAEVLFQVTLPPPLEPNPQYFLEVVDEVTGLPFNPTRYPLSQIDPTHYLARIPFNVGSIIKYRYIRMTGIPRVEYNARKEQVRYRLHQIMAPAILEDTIAGWEDFQYAGPKGNLEGTLTTTENIPIPNALIIAGGDRTFTNSEGHFKLFDLPAGKQNLSAMSLDGSQSYFEQGARIAENAVTPARIIVDSQSLVDVTFMVTPPLGDYSEIPLRLIGELYQLGNTFADLEGGMSTIASRSPILQYNPEEKIFQTVLSLPEGAYFHYKYSLGDGFWNAEMDKNEEFRLREMIVSSQETTIKDSIISFSSKDTAPVTFQVTVPADTPLGDTVSIQLNPFSWMGSIPMWSQGNNEWKIILSSPLNMVGQTGFRICRNDQCGTTDADMSGSLSAFTPAPTSQSIPLNITSWNWMNNQGAITPKPDQVPTKGGEYIAGVELQQNYEPRWQSFFQNTFSETKQLNSNWLFITPSWSVTVGENQVMGPQPGINPLWPDISQQIQDARAFRFKTAVFPSLIDNDNSTTGNTNTPKNKSQWDQWFRNYRSYLLFFADNASVNIADSLIIGGPNVAGSLPQSIAVTDLNSTSASDYSKKQWLVIINDLKAHFRGKIFWAVNFPYEFSLLPPFIDQLDGIYLLWDGISEYESTSTIESLTATISRDFPEAIVQTLSSYSKPVIVGLSIPSASGVGIDCNESDPACLISAALEPPAQPPPGVSLDLQKQVNIYASALEYFSNQSWVNGIVSRGYYPPAALMDYSSSIHGKPVSELIRHWFGGLTGITNP